MDTSGGEKMIETVMRKNYAENTEVADSLYPQKRADVLASIMTNHVKSGILLPWETSTYRDNFSRYDWDELLQILDESNSQSACSNPV